MMNNIIILITISMTIMIMNIDIIIIIIIIIIIVIISSIIFLEAREAPRQLLVPGGDRGCGPQVVRDLDTAIYYTIMCIN